MLLSIYLDQLITSHSRAIRYYIIFAVGLVVLGIVVMTGNFWLSAWLGPEFPNEIVSIGGGIFVSSLSTFPLKEIMNRRDKLEMFKAILEWSKTANAADQDESKRINELIWQAVEKTVLG
jgi:hypothetical protein